MAVADEQLRPFIALCAFAGLRLGEAAGVQLGDIDFLRRSLKVSRKSNASTAGRLTFARRSTVQSASSTSPTASSRWWPSASVLTARRARIGGSSSVRAANRRTRTPHRNTVGYWWRKTLHDARLTGIKLHDLRHFYTSGLIAAGCDVVTVQRSLGHAKATTTLNTYAHLWPTAEDRTRKAAESIMSASLGEPGAPQADFGAST
jgi:integrase